MARRISSRLVRSWENVFSLPHDLAARSGTTGRSKGCITTHRGTISQVIGVVFSGLAGALMGGSSPIPSGGGPPTNLVTTPLFHVSGLHSVTCTGLTAGAKLVFLDGKLKAGLRRHPIVSRIRNLSDHKSVIGSNRWLGNTIDVDAVQNTLSCLRISQFQLGPGNFEKNQGSELTLCGLKAFFKRSESLLVEKQVRETLRRAVYLRKLGFG